MQLHFHGGNLSELQDHVPVDILPSCLGGLAGQNDNAALVENLYKNEEYFKGIFLYFLKILLLSHGIYLTFHSKILIVLKSH